VVLAAKKSSRTAAEGLLAVAQDEKRAAVVELNCETDFVARNDVFQYLVRLILSDTICIIMSYSYVEPFQCGRGKVPFDSYPQYKFLLIRERTYCYLA
jgi:hypothetical protein